MTRRAFTLIELLVVVAIVAALAGVLAPGLAGAWASARNAKCLASLHQIAVAHAAYRAESDGHWPIDWTFYDGEPICPCPQGREYLLVSDWFDLRGVSFAATLDARAGWDHLEVAADCPPYRPLQHHNAGYLDGHARRRP